MAPRSIPPLDLCPVPDKGTSLWRLSRVTCVRASLLVPEILCPPKDTRSSTLPVSPRVMPSTTRRLWHDGPVPTNTSPELIDLPIGDLQDYPGNARVHDEAALDESVDTNGQYRAILARRLPDGGYQILAGHGTRGAVRRAGHDTIRVEVIEADDTEARRIVLADNGTSRQASYDDSLLLALLDDASKDGGLTGTGWDSDAYKELLDAADEGNPFDFGGAGEREGAGDEEPPEEPVTQTGDVWVLGEKHRVLCGSSTSKADIDTVTEGQAPGIVYTDPPYGISIVPDTGTMGISTAGVAARDYKPVIGDETTDTARDAFTLLTGAYPKALHVWWGANHYAGSAHLGDSPCWLVWDKVNDESFFADAELAWTNDTRAVRIFRHQWFGMIRASERGARFHPNQKPVALAQWALDLIDPDRKRTRVLDGFGGSGSTLIAAHITGRAARIIEMDPGYVDVILKRYVDLTGEHPILERTGVAWDFTATPPCPAA